ncbi:MAG: 23S rRNA (guanosine(2251)-2'-O)-methyltransferase RlmB [Ruminococcaceae bacterium]|nr:23S rRNA (guanosine(2251)-2'-O)-methyltransferase RlmB [Oscillospiraceae bacterium]
MIKNDNSLNNERENEKDVIFGRNSVAEAIKSGRPLDSVMVARGEKSGSIPKIVADAKKAGIVIKEVDSKKLDFICGHNNHQGIAAMGAVKEYSSIEDIFATAEERNEAPFIIICDEIEDPHNLGAIIRTAEAAGAHGVIIPKRRSASLSFTVAKTSAGAVEFMHVARVTNIPQTIEELKKRGVWVYCADMDGEPFYKSNLKGAIALVIGSEGNGVGRLVKEKCDVTLSMPMKGKINSLNASVAAGILMYEVSRQRD